MQHVCVFLQFFCSILSVVVDALCSNFYLFFVISSKCKKQLHNFCGVVLFCEKVSTMLLEGTMQSRLFALFLAMVILVLMAHFMPKELYKQVDLEDATCQVFCRSTSLAHMDVGFGKIVYCDGLELQSVLKHCQGVDGVSIRWQAKTQHVSAFLRKFDVQVHTKQTIGGLTVICGYSPKICGYINLDGCKTNVQIAFDGQTITVGSPLILGDY